MQVEKNDPALLHLDNQLCFALYVCSRGIIKAYKPILDPLDLTYTEYVVLMALWENDKIAIKRFGQKNFFGFWHSHSASQKNGRQKSRNPRTLKN